MFIDETQRHIFKLYNIFCVVEKSHTRCDLELIVNSMGYA